MFLPGTSLQPLYTYALLQLRTLASGWTQQNGTSECHQVCAGRGQEAAATVSTSLSTGQIMRWKLPCQLNGAQFSMAHDCPEHAECCWMMGVLPEGHLQAAALAERHDESSKCTLLEHSADQTKNVGVLQGCLEQSLLKHGLQGLQGCRCPGHVSLHVCSRPLSS